MMDPNKKLYGDYFDQRNCKILTVDEFLVLGRDVARWQAESGQPSIVLATPISMSACLPCDAHGPTPTN